MKTLFNLMRFVVNKWTISSMVLIVVIFSSSMFIYQNAKDTKEEVKSQLEALDFTVYQFDIVGSKENALQANISLLVSNIPKQESNQILSVSIESLNVKLYSEEMLLSSFNIPLTNEDLDKPDNNSTTMNFLTYIDIPEETIYTTDSFENTDITTNLVEKILLAELFTLNATFILYYSSLGIRDNLEFTNTIVFNLMQDPFQFYIDYIDVPTLGVLTTTAHIAIYNPFNVTISVKGTGKLFAQEYNYADISISDLKFDFSWNNISIQINLNDPPELIIDNLFNNYTSNFSIALDIKLEIDKTEILLQTDLPVISGNSSIFSIDLNNVDNFTIDLNSNYIEALFSIYIDYELPIELELLRISFNVTTLSQQFLGNITWVAKNKTMLIPHERLILYGFYLYNDHLNSNSMFQLVADSALSIPQGLFVLKIYDKKITVPFSIDRIDF